MSDESQTTVAATGRTTIMANPKMINLNKNSEEAPVDKEEHGNET